jgi:hypothetical protein
VFGWIKAHAGIARIKMKGFKPLDSGPFLIDSDQRVIANQIVNRASHETRGGMEESDHVSAEFLPQ